eukprot:3092746-Pleurochrysis_carterae.AAC.2
MSTESAVEQIEASAARGHPAEHRRERGRLARAVEHDSGLDAQVDADRHDDPGGEREHGPRRLDGALILGGVETLDRKGPRVVREPAETKLEHRHLRCQRGHLVRGRLGEFVEVDGGEGPNPPQHHERQADEADEHHRALQRVRPRDGLEAAEPLHEDDDGGEDDGAARVRLGQVEEHSVEKERERAHLRRQVDPALAHVHRQHRDA